LNSVILQDIWRGIFQENPVFRMFMGLCPLLGVSAYLLSGLSMGLIFTGVLICCNLIFALLQGGIPAQVRLPVFVIISATLVTTVDIILQVYYPGMREELGIYLLLLAVNCVFFARVEVFASRRPLVRSIFDVLGVGLGFTIAIVVLAGIRELLGTGALMGAEVFGPHFEPIRMLREAPGAFIALGLLMALANTIYRKYRLLDDDTENEAGEGGSLWNS